MARRSARRKHDHGIYSGDDRAEARSDLLVPQSPARPERNIADKGSEARPPPDPDAVRAHIRDLLAGMQDKSPALRRGEFQKQREGLEQVAALAEDLYPLVLQLQNCTRLISSGQYTRRMRDLLEATVGMGYKSLVPEHALWTHVTYQIVDGMARQVQKLLDCMPLGRTMPDYTIDWSGAFNEGELLARYTTEQKLEALGYAQDAVNRSIGSVVSDWNPEMSSLRRYLMRVQFGCTADTVKREHRKFVASPMGALIADVFGYSLGNIGYPFCPKCDARMVGGMCQTCQIPFDDGMSIELQRDALIPSHHHMLLLEPYIGVYYKCSGDDCRRAYHKDRRPVVCVCGGRISQRACKCVHVVTGSNAPITLYRENS